MIMKINCFKNEEMLLNHRESISAPVVQMKATTGQGNSGSLLVAPDWFCSSFGICKQYNSFMKNEREKKKKHDTK